MDLFTTDNPSAAMWLLGGCVVWRGRVNPFEAPQRIGVPVIVAGASGEIRVETPSGHLWGSGWLMPVGLPYQIVGGGSESTWIQRIDWPERFMRGLGDLMRSICPRFGRFEGC